MENQKCQGDKVKYKYSLEHDLITNERWIECRKFPFFYLINCWFNFFNQCSDNPVGTCGRNICECDKRWAETLAKHEDQFNSMFHKNRAENPSDWVYNNECRRTKGKFEKPEECCGTQYPDKMPLQKVSYPTELFLSHIYVGNHYSDLVFTNISGKAVLWL